MQKPLICYAVDDVVVVDFNFVLEPLGLTLLDNTDI